MLSGAKGSQYSSASAITKHDSNANVFKAIFCGGAGNLRVTTKDGDDVVFTGVAAGTIIPIATVLVWSTNTTTTNMTGLN